MITRSHAETSWLGIGLSIAWLIVMPAPGVAKRRLGARLGSGATAGEGNQNLLCAYLAAGVLAGLLTNAVLGWWWLDPVVALGIAGLAVREGVEAWHGEECGCWAESTASWGNKAPAGVPPVIKHARCDLWMHDFPWQGPQRACYGCNMIM